MRRASRRSCSKSQESQSYGSQQNHFLGFVTKYDQQEALALANFSPAPQKVDADRLRAHGIADTMINTIGPPEGQAKQIGDALELAPYQCMWLMRTDEDQPHLGEASKEPA